MFKMLVSTAVMFMLYESSTKYSQLHCKINGVESQLILFFNVFQLQFNTPNKYSIGLSSKSVQTSHYPFRRY